MPDQTADVGAPLVPEGTVGDGLSAQERARRQATIAAIERRVRVDGAHVARDDAHRARQFMPFAALKGYGALTRQREADADAACDEACEGLDEWVPGEWLDSV